MRRAAEPHEVAAGRRVLSRGDLTQEQAQCLQDRNRRGEAHAMLDDLRDRCGFDVEALRDDLPPYGRLRIIVERFTGLYERTSDGGRTALAIPCANGSHIEITDLDGRWTPDDDAQRVRVVLWTRDGPLRYLTKDRPTGDAGSIEVDVEEELESVLGAILEEAQRGALERAASSLAAGAQSGLDQNACEESEQGLSR